MNRLSMRRWVVALSVLMITAVAGKAQQERPYVVEYYYKVQWGHFDEFLELYKKNHYPVLQKQQEMGRIVRMSAAFPVYHAGSLRDGTSVLQSCGRVRLSLMTTLMDPLLLGSFILTRSDSERKSSADSRFCSSIGTFPFLLWIYRLGRCSRPAIFSRLFWAGGVAVVCNNSTHCIPESSSTFWRLLV